MKYIRAQDGGIYSVSRLKPPCRDYRDGEPFWKMMMQTASGENCVYATYSTEEMAVKVYSYITKFMGSIQNMLEFELGVDGKPIWMVEAEERERDLLVEEHLDESPTPRVEVRPWMTIPESDGPLRLWRRNWWPWRRKGGSE